MGDVYCRLAGGLGNQIFQYGLSLLLSKKTKKSKVLIDSTALSTYSAARINHLHTFFDCDYIETKSLVLRIRLGRLLSLKFKKNCFISDNNFTYILENRIDTDARLYLDGYFQSLSQKTFDEILALLSKQYSYASRQTLEGVGVLHIRGGDFLTSKYAGIATVDYYRESLEKLKKIKPINSYKVITDDIKYASQILENLDINYEFTDGTMLTDFLLIADAEVKLVSNSTFSLWAAALGFKEGMVVCAPKQLTQYESRTFMLPGELNQ